jgi:hypothetical protein
MASDDSGAPRKLWRLDARYLLAALVLFLVEVYIALYVHDAWVRPYGGDVLVVVFLYALVRGFADAPVVRAALGVLVFAFIVELLQYFHLVDRLGHGGNPLARVVLGSSVSWGGLGSNTLGASLVLLCERAHGPWRTRSAASG